MNNKIGHKENKGKLILLASFCCLLWGTAIPVLKLLYGDLEIPSSDIYNKLVLAGLRFMMGGLFIGVFILIRNKSIQLPKGKQWVSLAIFGLLNTTLQYMFFYIGVGNTGAIKGVLLDTSKPLLVVLMAHFFTKDDKITKGKIVGLCLGTIGILVANLDQLSTGGFSFDVSLGGEGFLLFASIVYALAVIYGKHVMKTMGSTMMNMYQMILGSSLLLILGLIGGKGFNLHFTWVSIALLLYSALLSAIAFVLWYHLIQQYSASMVSIYIFLIPVFGTIFSSILFVDEHLSGAIIVTLIIMSISIYLVNRSEKKL